ncbi:hypothetical protein ACUY2X_04535 [Corynebacterium minutissimum]
MKISRSLVAAALSGALVLGGTTAAFAANEGVPLSDTLVYNGVTYYKNSKGDFVPAPDSKDESGKAVNEVITAADMEDHVKNGDAKAPESAGKESESEETTSETATTSEKTTTSAKATTSETATTSAKATTSETATTSAKASESASATKSSATSASATTTKSSDSSTTASATTTPSSSKSAEPTPSKDKKGSARDALSSKDGKPTPLAIFGIVAGVLAAVAAAFPVIAKTLNLNIKLPF